MSISKSKYSTLKQTDCTAILLKILWLPNIYWELIIWQIFFTGRNPRSGHIKVKAKLTCRWLSPVTVWTAQFGSKRSFRDSGSFHFTTLHPLDVVLNCKVEMRSQWLCIPALKVGKEKKARASHSILRKNCRSYEYRFHSYFIRENMAIFGHNRG